MLSFYKVDTITLASLALVLITITSSESQTNGGLKQRSKPLGPCQACKALINSFQKGLDRTESNDSSVAKGVSNKTDNQTEENSKDFYSSENVRFDKITSQLCLDVKVGKDMCLDLAKNHSQLLQEWWQSYRTHSDLLTWLCIDKLQVCCPPNHYGPQCTPCTGYPDAICSGHGKCKGNGTRKGNGACICEVGYIGELCDTCAKMYYEAYKDESKIICSSCHRACQGGCSGPGPKGCDACLEGWEVDEEKGCLDINECLMLEKSCKKDEFCVNTAGSYACWGCDKSCDGCYGDGPDMCEKCAPGYKLIDKLCIDISAKERDRKVDLARYMTYFGLCVSTCIIFQKNMAIASVIGVAVGVYIATSEYLLNEEFS